MTTPQTATPTEGSKTPKGKLVLLIGPSGVGKSVVLKALMKSQFQFHFPRSATTRKKRPKEKGTIYHFVSDEEFNRLLEDEKFLEWATVHEGARYGTLIEEIIPYIEEGKIVVREVDVQGFDSIRHHHLFEEPDAPYTLESIFILPESKEQLIERIKKRAPITEKELQHRIESMEKEFAYADLCIAQVKNIEGQLPQTIEEVTDIILSSSS